MRREGVRQMEEVLWGGGHLEATQEPEAARSHFDNWNSKGKFPQCTDHLAGEQQDCAGACPTFRYLGNKQMKLQPVMDKLQADTPNQ